MNRVSAAVTPVSWSTASRSTTSTSSSNLDRSWPPGASLNSLDHGLQVHLWFTWSQPPSASPNSLDHGPQAHRWVQLELGLQVHLWVTRSGPPNASSNSLNQALQVHLQTRCITASKCIYELLDHSLSVLLQTLSITASQCISEFNSISACKWIFELTPSRPPSTSPSSHNHGLQAPL